MERKSPKNQCKNRSEIWFDPEAIFGAFLMDFGSQNGVKVGAKSNPMGTSPQKGTHHEHTVNTKQFSMFFGVQGVDLEQNSMGNRSKIEAEIRGSFFDDFLSILGAFWSHFGSHMVPKNRSKNRCIF